MVMQHCSLGNINYWTLVIVETVIENSFWISTCVTIPGRLRYCRSLRVPWPARATWIFQVQLKFNLKLAASLLRLVLPVFKFCSSILPLPPGSRTRSSSSESIPDHFDHDASDILIMMKLWGIHLIVYPDLQCQIQVTHCQWILISTDSQNIGYQWILVSTDLEYRGLNFAYLFLCHQLRICQNTKYANKGAQNFIMLRFSRKRTSMSNWENASGLCSLFPHQSSGILRWNHW